MRVKGHVLTSAKTLVKEDVRNLAKAPARTIVIRIVPQDVPIAVKAHAEAIVPIHAVAIVLELQNKNKLYA